jgi:predicted amidohydrolase YtcJ
MRHRKPYRIEGLSLAGDRFARRPICVVEGRIQDADVEGPCWTLSAEHVLIPAFHDHHTHLIGTFRPAQGPSLDGIPTRAGALEAAARWLRDRPGVGPVLGEGWDESIWDDPRPLTGADLDRLSTDRPLGLRRVDGHLVAVNSVAWTLLAPSGVEADPRTQTMTESLAMGLPAKWAPPFSDYVLGAREGRREAARQGVASIDEMGRIETYRAFRELEAEGSLGLRVRHFFPIDRLEAVAAMGLRPGDDGGFVRAFGLKGFLDGSIGARTAAVEQPFKDRPGDGLLLWETEALAEAVRAGTEAGFSIALHAIGMRAVRQALEAYRRVGGGRAGTELRIEHAEELDLATIDLARRLRVILSMQPNFTARWQGPDGMYERALGPERARALNPYRTAARSTRVVFGSDTMPFGPLGGIRGALAHPDPAERLTAAEAIAAYATGGLDSTAGFDVLRQGVNADLAVLHAPGGDLPRAILEGTARVCWTAVGGRTVWAEADGSIPEAILEASR